MSGAVRIVAASFGIFASIGSVEHGLFELMQGHTRPDGMMITSIGPPCQPEQAWHACEPAMTVLPSFFFTGILAICLGLIGIVWSLLFLEKQHGGVILILLCTAMLLFGGGIFPPLIGIIGGLVARQIGRPLTWRARDSHAVFPRVLASLWPWVLVLFFVLLFGQWVVGLLANEFMQRLMIGNLIVILALLVTSVLSAFAWDFTHRSPNCSGSFQRTGGKSDEP